MKRLIYKLAKARVNKRIEDSWYLINSMHYNIVGCDDIDKSNKYVEHLIDIECFNIICGFIFGFLICAICIFLIVFGTIAEYLGI